MLLPSQQAPASLLDLPDLALESIAENLPLPDIASCMMCCTLLRTLLQPRLSAMVRARSLGRRWVLRACGHALFADVAARYKAEVVGFEYEGPDATHWNACRTLGRHVAETGERQSRMCVRIKSLISHFFEGIEAVSLYIDLGCFVYLFKLAESRGFNGVVKMLEKVWERMVLGPRRGDPRWDLEWAVQELTWETGKPDFAFRPGVELASNGYFRPREEFWNDVDALGDDEGSLGTVKLRTRLVIAAKDLLRPELLSTIFFTTFMQRIYSPRSNGQLAEVWTPLFEMVLDLRLQ